MPTILIAPADPAEAGGLIRELDAYQASLYPAESNHLLPLDALRHPNVTFLVARVDDQVAGCGAFVRYVEYAEIKRMFVSPEFRGLKLGRRILEEIEWRIRAAGLALARLETGVSQPEALRLYESAGYLRCGPFGEYREDHLSVFMEKHLR